MTHDMNTRHIITTSAQGLRISDGLGPHREVTPAGIVEHRGMFGRAWQIGDLSIPDDDWRTDLAVEIHVPADGSMPRSDAYRHAAHRLLVLADMLEAAP